MAAEEEEFHASHEGEDDYVSERERRRRRFVELGGDVSIDMDLRCLKATATDMITDRHRDLVTDLAASGLSHEAVANIMGMSESWLRKHFQWELDTGFERAHASLARSLWKNGMSGDTQAALGWLRSHNRGKWATKQEQTDKGAEQSTQEATSVAAANAKFLAEITAGLMTDQKHRRPDTKKAPPKVSPQTGVERKPIIKGTTVKSPRSES